MTTPRGWSNAATRWGVTTPARRAPRMVLPSTAITRRPLTTVVVVHIHAPITASSTSGSSLVNSRRNTDASGLRGLEGNPNAAAVDASWSASQDATATEELAPASVAAMAAATNGTRS